MAAKAKLGAGEEKREERSPESQASWMPILHSYQQGSSLFPPFLFLHTKRSSHTKDSAPGLDGIPHAAWRLNPAATSHAICLAASKVQKQVEVLVATVATVH